jgi:hypothetical protein
MPAGTDNKRFSGLFIARTEWAPSCNASFCKITAVPAVNQPGSYNMLLSPAKQGGSSK